jgi:hypothetical protein
MQQYFNFFQLLISITFSTHRIGLHAFMVDHGFELRFGQTKDYKIGICCFSAQHTAFRSKNKD